MTIFFFFFLRNMNDKFLCGQKNIDVLGLFFNWLLKKKKKYKPEIMWMMDLSDSIRITSPLLEHPSTREHNLTEMGMGHKYWTMKTDEQ